MTIKFASNSEFLVNLWIILVHPIHSYRRDGFGQFENVEFKGMGQYGHSSYDDFRAQILFYKVNIAGDIANK